MVGVVSVMSVIVIVEMIVRIVIVMRMIVFRMLMAIFTHLELGRILSLGAGMEDSAAFAAEDAAMEIKYCVIKNFCSSFIFASTAILSTILGQASGDNEAGIRKEWQAEHLLIYSVRPKFKEDNVAVRPF